jgi:DNA-binding NarL/FixJ family response regulator
MRLRTLSTSGGYPNFEHLLSRDLVRSAPLSDRREAGPRVMGKGGSARSVLLVDADVRVRNRIAADLEQAGFAVVQATTGEEAVAIARDQAPELLILEVALDGICGYELCRRFRQEFGEELPIIFLSGQRTEWFDRVAGLLIGADDYLTKPVASDELLARARRLLSRTTRPTEAESTPLTSRELEVLELLADGLSHNDIAERLVISAKTVGSHVEHILRKLDARNSAQAVAVAYRERLVGATKESL